MNLIVDLYITFKTRQCSVSDFVKEQGEQEGCHGSTHPCLSPLRTSKGAVNVSLILTTAFMPSCSLRMSVTNFSGKPHFRSKGPKYVPVNCIVVSKKQMVREHCCSLAFSCNCLATKTMSLHPCIFLKPHCVSSIIVSASFLHTVCNDATKHLPWDTE